MSQRHVTARLADFLREAEPPPEAVREVKRLLLNGLSATLMCQSSPNVRLLARWAAEHGSGSRPAQILWSGEQAVSELSALVNAAAWEFDSLSETYLPTYIHPTAAPAAAALSEGQVAGSSGAEVIRAVALGIETMIALSHILMPGAYERGFAPIPIHSSVGAAATCVALRRLERDKGASALGIAMLGSAGPFECAGSGSHSYITGNGVRGGIVAAQLAERGLDTAVTAFEGERGMLAAFSGGGADRIETWIDELGSSWRLGELAYMAYPAETYMQACLECVMTAPARPRDAALTFRVNPLVARIAAERAARFGLPQTETQTTSDLRFALAAAWLSGQFGRQQKNAATREDPDVLALREAIVLEPDDDVALAAARLDVVDADGRSHSVAVDAFAGSPARPMSDADLVAKLHETARGSMEETRVEEIAQTTLGLERCDDIRELVGLLHVEAPG